MYCVLGSPGDIKTTPYGLIYVLRLTVSRCVSLCLTVSHCVSLCLAVSHCVSLCLTCVAAVTVSLAPVPFNIKQKYTPRYSRLLPHACSVTAQKKKKKTLSLTDTVVYPKIYIYIKPIAHFATVPAAVLPRLCTQSGPRSSSKRGSRLPRTFLLYIYIYIYIIRMLSRISKLQTISRTCFFNGPNLLEMPS
jgi:hypothetical protein